MRNIATIGLLTALAVGLALPSHAGQSPAVQIKILETPANPTQQTVLIGRAMAGDMVIQLELEPAQSMWMATTASVQLKKDAGNGSWVLFAMPPVWSVHEVAAGELYHVEVKPFDARSKTRISYASVMFQAVNRDSGQSVEGELHPMWGDSGLHYALNSAFVGDGRYEVTVTVGVPTFARNLEDKNRWMNPTIAKFHFKLDGGRITEVSVPDAV